LNNRKTEHKRQQVFQPARRAPDRAPARAPCARPPLRRLTRRASDRLRSGSRAVRPTAAPPARAPCVRPTTERFARRAPERHSSARAPCFRPPLLRLARRASDRRCSGSRAVRPTNYRPDVSRQIDTKPTTPRDRRECHISTALSNRPLTCAPRRSSADKQRQREDADIK
jgi:hypothetical protein